MGTLETPQDRHRLHTQDGASRVEQTDRGPGEQELGRPWRSRELGRPWRSRELGRPWWDRFRDCGPSPHLSLFGRSPTTPPPKISLGKFRGIRSPPGLNTHKQFKKTVVTVWSNTATAGWLVNTAAAVWGYHNRLA